jgi:hypothetical protein
MKKAKLAALSCAFGVIAFGSHITAVTENGGTCALAFTCGSAVATVAITNFDTTGGLVSSTAAGMAGMIISGIFVGGASAGSCTWSNATAGCSNA